MFECWFTSKTSVFTHSSNFNNPTTTVLKTNSLTKEHIDFVDMGISNLLEQLKSIIQRSHISEFKGKKVAIDAHCWLHRGAFSCSKELAKGAPTEKFISFFINLVKMLKRNGVNSILVVFDGLPLPNKTETNRKRSDDRKKNLLLAEAAEASGDAKLAMTYYQRSVSVTFEMVQKLLIALRAEDVHFMVSPYESDAQLAFLSKANIVDLIITEDSDAIPYGCAAVLFKMDKDGYGDLFQHTDIRKNQTLSFANWTDDQFQLFCCLSGCDYMPGISNLGIKSAYKIVNRFKTLTKVVDHLQMSNYAVGYEGYLPARLEMALLTFKHQTIFNPFSNCTEPLTPLPLSVAYLGALSADNTPPRGLCGAVSRSTFTANQPHLFDFLGPMLDTDIAKQLVVGNLDPRTVLKADESPGVPAQASLGSAEQMQHRGEVPEAPHTPVTAPRAGPLIRWFTSEERTAHTAHAQQRQGVALSAADMLSDKTPASHPARQSQRKDSSNQVTTVTGRKRSRPSAVAHGQLSSLSTASAQHATSQYQSALISDYLEPLHRRARLRVTDTNYLAGKSATVTRDMAALCLSRDANNHYEADFSASDVGEYTASEPTDWVQREDEQPPEKRGRFFDDLSQPSPIQDPFIDPYEPREFVTWPHHTLDQDGDADCEDSYRDDAYFDAQIFPSPATSASGGLPQFQDDYFEAHMAHRYSLHAEEGQPYARATTTAAANKPSTSVSYTASSDFSPSYHYCNSAAPPFVCAPPSRHLPPTAAPCSYSVWPPDMDQTGYFARDTSMAQTYAPYQRHCEGSMPFYVTQSQTKLSEDPSALFRNLSDEEVMWKRQLFPGLRR